MATYIDQWGGLSRGGRQYNDVTCASSTGGISGSDVLPFHGFAMGLIVASSTQSATSVKVYTATGSSTATPYRLYDEDGVASALTIGTSDAVGYAAQLPSEVAGCEYLAFLANAAASVKVVFKS